MSDTAESGQITGKVLVVEDNAFVRMQIVRYLSDAGFETVEAEEGRKAMEIVDKTINLAIVDVRMEPVDGFEFIKSLRAKGLSMPVFLVTGDQNPDLLSEANRLGVNVVLMKPVQKDRLVKMAARAIQQART